MKTTSMLRGLGLKRKRRARQKMRQRRLQLESLETRRVLATAQLTIFVDGVQQDIPANIGVDGGGMAISQTRTLTGDGTITIDPIANEQVTDDTLGDFFDTWRTNAGAAGNNPDATFDFDTLLNNDANATSTVQMFVNGLVTRTFDDHVFQDGDEIVLVYGSNPVISLNTQAGPIVLELFESDAPITVDNFLNYVNDGDYLNSIFHRLDPNFVLQGGSFTTTDRTITTPSQWGDVPTDPPIQNEFGISNTRRTVAMALNSNGANSATSGFFVNIRDNTNSLDPQSFAVFAQVLDMGTVDEIESFDRITTNPFPLNNIPVDGTDQVTTIASIEGQGDITGTKFLDANENGVQDAGENGVEGSRVYIDANNNGVFDTGEIFATTDANGEYLLQAAPGTHTVRADNTAGRRTTLPNGESYTVTLEIGREVENRDFGEATITTTDAMDDVRSGVDPGETVTIDVTANDIVSNLSDGTLTIIAVTQGSAGGQVAINGASIDYTPSAALAGVETFTYTIQDSLGTTDTATVEATTERGTISGFVYVDGDDDGVRSDGEAGVPAVLVTLTGTTTSGTGVLRTFMTLPGGSYTFGNLEPGTYSVSERQPSALSDGLESSDFSGATIGDDVISQLVISGNDVLENNNFGESGLSSRYVSLQMFLVRSTMTAEELFRDRLAMGEQDAGNLTIAEDIRNGLFGEQTNNTAPNATNDQYTVTEDQTLNVNAATGVLNNDADAEGDTLTAVIVSTTSNGSLTLNDDGSFDYTPTTGFVGTDSFVYQAVDNTLSSAETTVTITVEAGNTAPVASDDSGANFTTAEDTTLTASTSILANDTDADGDMLTARKLTDPSSGSLTFNSDGTFIYIPAPNVTGDVTFTYEAFDGNVASDPATVTITLTPVNDPVNADDDTLVDLIAEDSVDATFQFAELIANDDDPDGDTLSLDSFTQPANGTLSENAGVFTYNPNADFNGTDTFTYTVTDGSSTDTATVSIVVTPVNDAPVAMDDQFATAVDTTLNAPAPGVLTGDSDLEGTALTVDLATVDDSNVNGSLTVFADGSFNYTPTQGFQGTATFTYQATDGELNSVAATVTIIVNNRPVAADDAVTVTEDTPLSISIQDDLINGTGTDSDADGDSLQFVSFTQPSNGSVTQDNGTLTYTPADNFNGTDTFTYVIRDGLQESDPATVTITVNPVNDPVAASDDTLANAIMEDAVDATFDLTELLQNDSDPDGTVPNLEGFTQPANGSLTEDGGIFTYNPNANFNGNDTFTYTIGDGESTDTATVTIPVTAVNDAPDAVDDSLSAVLEDAVDATFNLSELLTNDTDTEGTPLILVGFTQPVNGTLSEDNGVFTYNPADNFNGADTFTYTITDGDLEDTATVMIPVTPVNDAPVAAADQFSTPVGVELIVPAAGVLDGDTDADGDGLTVDLASIDDASLSGTLTPMEDGGFSYTPDPAFHGSESFTYQATDGNLNSNAATVTILVNTAPVANDDTLSATEDVALSISIAEDLINGTGVDTDVDSDPLALVSFTQPANGTLTDNGDGTLTYEPDAEFNGTDTFTYVINDGFEDAPAAATVSITVAAVNDAPSAHEDTLANTIAEDAVDATFNFSELVSNDTDPENDVLTLDGFTQPAHGSLTEDGGVFTYNPDLNFNGTDTFTYTVSDGDLTDTATVMIPVTPINDAPVANDDAVANAVPEDAADATFNFSELVGNDTDVEGDTLSLDSFTQPASGTLMEDNGVFTYHPALNFNGTDTFTYTVSDGEFTDTATVTIPVTAVNDAPVANDDTVANAVPEDAADATFNLSELVGNDTDAEGDTLTLDSFTQPANGSLTEDGGVFTYNPTLNFSGADTFTYTVTDGELADTATVTINVSEVNDTPIANDDTLPAIDFETPLLISVADDLLANDTDVESTPTLSSFGQPSNGTLVNNNNGTLTYTPNDDFEGDDSFTYEISDGAATSPPATVNLSVRPQNTFEVAENSAEGAVVGTVMPNGTFTGNMVYEIENISLAAQLALNADDHYGGADVNQAVLIEYLDFQ